MREPDTGCDTLCSNNVLTCGHAHVEPDSTFRDAAVSKLRRRRGDARQGSLLGSAVVVVREVRPWLDSTS